MVAVAQLVRAPDCGSGSRGFESPQSPFQNIPSGRLKSAVSQMPCRYVASNSSGWPQRIFTNGLRQVLSEVCVLLAPVNSKTIYP